jgi:predicted dehydrogenase
MITYMKSEKIGIGIVGLGGRGIYLAKEIFSKYPDCEVTGLHDIQQQKIDEARKVFGNIPGSTSIDEFLAFPGLDMVIVSSPDHVHAENCLKVLAAKKHVYLEKPMAQKIEDCDAMIDAWPGTGTVFMVGLELRYCTLMQDMKKIIESGEVGDIKIGTVIDNVSVGGNNYYHSRNRRRKEYIKSLILEKGTHSLDLANWLVDSSPRKVYCSAGLDVFGGNEPNDKRCGDCDNKKECAYFVPYERYKTDFGAVIERSDLCVYSKECDVNDNSLVIIDYHNGARICYMECHFTPEYTREFMFVGTKGKIYGFYNNEQEFKITVWKRHAKKADVYLPERTGGSHGGGDERIAAEFIKRVKEGKPSMPGVLGARDSVAIAVAAEESAETGMPVYIPEKKIPAGEER